MLKNKLIKYLQRLENSEINEFGKFLKKNYPNHEATLAVFKYLKSFHPTYSNAKKLDIDFASCTLFNKQGSSDMPDHRTKLLNTLSDLFLHLKDFLIQQKTKRGSLEEEWLWIDILLQRDLRTDASKHLDRFPSNGAQMPAMGDTHYFLQFALPYLNCYKIPKKKLEQGYWDLAGCYSKLDVFYHFIQIKLACELANRKQFLAKEKLKKKKKNKELSQMTLPKFQFSPVLLEAHPLIHIYHDIYLLIQTEDNVHYDSAFELLSQHASGIEKQDLLILITYLNNHAANQILKGNKVFLQKPHDLNLLGLKHGTFTMKGLLTVDQYLNIIAFACRAQKFKWVEKFIAQHERTFDEHTSYLSLGIVAFWQKDFKAALDLLEKVDTGNIAYMVRARPLILACSYELDEVDDRFIDMSKTFERFLREEKALRRGTIIAMKTFLQFFHKLLRKKIDQQKLINEINGSQAFLKDWLLEKANNYLNPDQRHK